MKCDSNQASSRVEDPEGILQRGFKMYQLAVYSNAQGLEGTGCGMNLCRTL